MTDIRTHLRNAARGCTAGYEMRLSIDNIRELVALIDRDWQPIETARLDERPVIIAVTCPGRDPIIGEARLWQTEWGPEWYWAGSVPNTYADGPISEINFGAPTHWMPRPAAPANRE